MLVLVPVSLMIITFAPLFQLHPRLGQVEPTPALFATGLDPEKQPEKIVLASNYFSFSEEEKPAPLITLVPSFDIERRGPNTKVVPVLFLYHLGEKGILQLKLTERFLWDDLFRTLGQRSPESREKIIFNSLDLSTSKAWFQFWRFNKSLPRYIRVHNALADKLPYALPAQAQRLMLGDRPFLRFFQDLRPLGFPELSGVHLLIPLHSSNPVVLELRVRGNPGPWQDELLQAFLGKARWMVDQQAELRPFILPEKIEDMNLLGICDFYTDSRLTGAQRRLLEDYIYQTYFDMADLASKNEELRQLILLALGRLEQVATLMNKQYSGHFSIRYLNLLKTLRISMENKYWKYFKEK